MPKRIVLPEDELRQKYIKEKCSLRETAKHFGVTGPCVRTNMRHYNIETRSLSESHKGQRVSPKTEFKKGQKPHNYLDLPEEKIVKLYTEKDKSCTEIADMFNVSHKTILKRLHKNNVKIKGASHFLYNKKASEETRKKLSQIKKGKPQPQLQTKEVKEKVGESLKRTHQEKTFGWEVVARKIRKNGGTKAELYFEKLLNKNKINCYEKEYIIPTETRVRFSIDFAFPHCLLGIELDGSSHKRRKTHDRKRDNKLRSYGWKIIRIKNRTLFKNPQKVIEEVKSLI